MPTIRLETFIAASLERCFDLSLSVDLHHHSVAHTSERPVAGVTSGVMKLGDTVTWEAVHFGIKQHLTTKITAYCCRTLFPPHILQASYHARKRSSRVASFLLSPHFPQQTIIALLRLLRFGMVWSQNLLADNERPLIQGQGLFPVS
jgi:hypothetical protein